MRPTILINANAGALSPSLDETALRAALETAELDAEIAPTQSLEEMQAILRRLREQNAELVAVCGGDGTVHQAAQILAGSQTALGIIAQGTFNNFATALRLPDDLPSALRVLKTGEKRAIDLGCIELGDGSQRFFTEAAGVGFFADGLALYGKGSNKNFRRGLQAATRLLLSFRAKRVEIAVDGETIRERALQCTVSNTYRMAQGITVAPGAKLTDGVLDVVIVGDLSWRELWPYYRAFRAQSHLHLPKVRALQGKTIKIRAVKGRMNVHCDDQFLGHTPATIVARPKALLVMVERL